MLFFSRTRLLTLRRCAFMGNPVLIIAAVIVVAGLGIVLWRWFAASQSRKTDAPTGDDGDVDSSADGDGHAD